MRHTASLTLLALIALIATHVLAAESATKAIDGEWTLLELDKGGKVIAANQMPGPLAQAVTVINNGKYTVNYLDRPLLEGTVTIDSSKKPQTYEVKAQDRKGKAVVMRGIFEFDAKGRLRMRFDDGADSKTPTSFETKGKPGQLNVYERAK